MQRTCPVTGEAMVHEVIDGITVDRSSAGMWLDKGEFLLLTEKARHAQPRWMMADLWRTQIRTTTPAGRQLACPVCGETMQIETLHGVQVDWCKEHGTWLDAGEFEAILNNLRLDPLYLRKVATRLWEARY